MSLFVIPKRSRVVLANPISDSFLFFATSEETPRMPRVSAADVSLLRSGVAPANLLLFMLSIPFNSKLRWLFGF
jgi:hypothetical protein